MAIFCRADAGAKRCFRWSWVYCKFSRYPSGTAAGITADKEVPPVVGPLAAIADLILK